MSQSSVQSPPEIVIKPTPRSCLSGAVLAPANSAVVSIRSSRSLTMIAPCCSKKASQAAAEPASWPVWAMTFFLARSVRAGAQDQDRFAVGYRAIEGGGEAFRFFGRGFEIAVAMTSISGHSAW